MNFWRAMGEPGDDYETASGPSPISRDVLPRVWDAGKHVSSFTVIPSEVEGFHCGTF
jgi:hypothetical protein